MNEELVEVLEAEMITRMLLNKAREEREFAQGKIDYYLMRLNHHKREAYRLGFDGNIMRDADGNRVDKL